MSGSAHAITCINEDTEGRRQMIFPLTNLPGLMEF